MEKTRGTFDDEDAIGLNRFGVVKAEEGEEFDCWPNMNIGDCARFLRGLPGNATILRAGGVVKLNIGIPVPIPFIFGDNFFSKILININKLLIKIFPRLFSYQVLLSLKPSLTLKKMLINTVKNSKF